MTYVLSDIHGNMSNFKSILVQINLQPEDTLYVLGDVIDRYPDGIRIIRMIMAMPNVKMLLGNHEHMMLQTLTTPQPDFENKWDREFCLWYRNGGAVTHEYLKHIRKAQRQEVFDFLKGLPVNEDVEVNGIKYKLVHGSPVENFKAHWSEYASPEEFAVWERWDQYQPIPEGYTLVFGHTPTVYFQYESPLKIWFGDNAIGIDCGGGFSERKNTYHYKGRLACLRLDDMKEFYSDTKI